MTPVRLEPATLRSRVKHSTTEPLRSHKYMHETHFSRTVCCIENKVTLQSLLLIYIQGLMQASEEIRQFLIAFYALLVYCLYPPYMVSMVHKFQVSS